MSELKTGILLVNLGTPDSPSTGDVRKYLREFLSDPRVVDINAIGRFLLVNLIIAPFRAPKSAKLYSEVWTDKGSPLLLYTVQQKEALAQLLGPEYKVEYAMRYQSPSMESVLEKFKQPVYKKIKVIPLFPQYASATTGSVHQKVMDIVSKWEIVPEIEFINSFCDDPDMIRIFADRGRALNIENHDHIIFSFHGLPKRQIRKGDCFNHCLKDNCCDTLTEKNAFCYSAQCHRTAHLIAAELGLSREHYSISFQSRLGRDPWIQPYSDEIIKQRAKAGDKRLLIFAPAFVSDCLETIHEIGVEYDELFHEHGGEKVTLVPSLNDHPEWTNVLAKMARS
jgi:ferrochelatase